MKRGSRHVSLTLMLSLVAVSLYGQASVNSQRVSLRDSTARTVKISYPHTVSWWDSGNGFICRSSADGHSYLTRYDKQGNYIETLMQKPWNESSPLWRAFHSSEYKSMKILSYWEVWDIGRKGYCLETIDSKKQVSNVWVDESLKFSTVPLSNK